MAALHGWSQAQNLKELIPAYIRNKANEFLHSCRVNAKNLAEILQMFEAEADDYTPLLLTIEVIFTELLKRSGLDMIVCLTSADPTYCEWLRECYETATTRALECMTRGQIHSRLEALMTACKLMQAEGSHMQGHDYYRFPDNRISAIFTALLDSEVSMTVSIIRFQEFTEYKDVQQFGLQMLYFCHCRKLPSETYMCNYLELLDVLVCDIPLDHKPKEEGDREEKEVKLLCGVNGRAKFEYYPGKCRRYANACWGVACQWPLMKHPRTQRRALILLVKHLLPLLYEPNIATGMMCYSLNSDYPTTCKLALQGVLEIIRRHNIFWFEPDMFATRYKRHLLHVAYVFLSSTHFPKWMECEFAKRACRLALTASNEDAAMLQQLVANLVAQHPPLKRLMSQKFKQHISK